ncbi:MAG: ABC transporter permease [Nanoarchaeota archaeon]|nr:ABC transporter permease [Nanoarchaeota archaeon]MBU1704233.1 ABC transporter permease [Nanoarchaeota archaeon]
MRSETVKYALKNLWERKSRTFLTALSIVIGIAAVFIFASFGLGLYSYVGDIAEQAGIDKFMVQGKGMSAPGLDDTFGLDESDLKAIEQAKGVTLVSGWYIKAAEVEKDRKKVYVFLSGVSDEKDQLELLDSMIGVDVNPGRQFRTGDKGRVVLGYNYAVPDKVFAKPYKLGDKITINGVKFDIIGFYESIGNPSDDSNVYMVYDDIKELFGDLKYGVVIGQVDDVEQMDKITERVEKNLRKNRGLAEGKEDFEVQSFQEAFAMFTDILNIVIGFIFLIVIISAIVASVNTANTMVTSVLERIREIGVMKSIGATNQNIRALFLFESSLIGTVGGIIGVALGWCIAALGGVILDQLGWGFLAPRFSVWIFVICILLSALVGAFSGLAPALYAAKQKPVDALRYE